MVLKLSAYTCLSVCLSDARYLGFFCLWESEMSGKGLRTLPAFNSFFTVQVQPVFAVPSSSCPQSGDQGPGNRGNRDFNLLPVGEATSWRCLLFPGHSPGMVIRLLSYKHLALYSGRAGRGASPQPGKVGSALHNMLGWTMSQNGFKWSKKCHGDANLV